MQYLSEINGFYDWLETNQLSANAINLWHALMNTANKASWVHRFTVAISTLEGKTGLQRKTVERARNELAQKGRITWKKRSGNQSAEYTIISLYDKKSVLFDAQPVAQSVAQPVAQSVAQPVVINRLDKTITLTLSDGTKKIISDSLAKTLNELLQDQIYIERICMNNQIKSTVEIQDYLKLFFAFLENGGEKFKTVADAKDHFSKWLLFQLDKKAEKEERRTKSNERNSKQSSDADSESRTRKEAILHRLNKAVTDCNSKNT